MESLKKAWGHPRCVATGEFGIDRCSSEKRATTQNQQEVFKRHVRLGPKLNKPLVLHLRHHTALDTAEA